MEKHYWQFWRDGARSAAENMALDECLLESMRDEDQGTVLRVYGWSEPAFTIGYFQPYNSAPHGPHTIVRRPSGGGVVDHRNDLTFTLVFPKTSPLFLCDRFESYRLINDAVRRGFMSIGIDCWLFDGDIPTDHDRSYLVCFQQPARFDVVNTGGKLCGGAQRRKLFGMLHQGSILLEQLVGYSKEELTDALKSAFENAFDITFVDMTVQDTFITTAVELAGSRFASDAWNKKK